MSGLTPVWTGPNHHTNLRTWAAANGHEVGPNGYVAPATVAAFLQHERRRQAADRITGAMP